MVTKRLEYKKNGEIDKATAIKLLCNITSFGTLGLQISTNTVQDVATARMITYFGRSMLKELILYLQDLKYEIILGVIWKL